VCRGVHDNLMGTFLALLSLAEASSGGAYLAVVSDIFDMMQGQAYMWRLAQIAGLIECRAVMPCQCA